MKILDSKSSARLKVNISKSGNKWRTHDLRKLPFRRYQSIISKISKQTDLSIKSRWVAWKWRKFLELSIIFRENKEFPNFQEVNENALLVILTCVWTE